MCSVVFCCVLLHSPPLSEISKSYIYDVYLRYKISIWKTFYLPKILVKSTGIRLYLPFSDWFWTKRNSVWFQIKRKMVNTIWFRLIRQESQVDFSACKVTETQRKIIVWLIFILFLDKTNLFSTRFISSIIIYNLFYKS